MNRWDKGRGAPTQGNKVFSIADLARAIGACAEGEVDLCVTGMAEPAVAGPDDLALALTHGYLEGLKDGRARTALIPKGVDWRELGVLAVIRTSQPRLTFAELSAFFVPDDTGEPGIDPSARIAPDAEIGSDVSVGPFTVIEAGASIGHGSVIGAQCFVGRNARLGPSAQLRDGVRIAARACIGARFVAQPGAVIGADGFSFEKRRQRGMEREGSTCLWARIHSLGTVEIGDDVEVGACSCVDRGTVRATRIGNGVKIDNQVQIGHNVIIGDDSLVCAQAGIAGSSEIGSKVIIGGRGGVADHLTIGDNAVIAAGSGLLSNVPAGTQVMGYPAMPMEIFVPTYRALRRLPRLLSTLVRGNPVAENNKRD